MTDMLDTLATYLSGVDANGRVAAESYATWNGDAPASYGAVSNAAKWGASSAGTGATISYSFEMPGQWTSAEKSAVLSTFTLWSSIANISFVETSAGNAQLRLTHEAGIGSAAIDTLTRGTVGGTMIGTAQSAHIGLSSAISFPSDLSADDGLAWGSLIYQVGRILGLGNAGPYAPYDFGDHYTTRDGDLSLNSVMSNRVVGTINYGNGITYPANYHYAGEPEDLYLPTTWRGGDIVALQRLYGLPTNSPLSAGVTFGFNTNLTGPLAQFFDFSRNQQPIVTLWSPGTGNKLDLSGFTEASRVDLTEGSFNSVAGLEFNLAIAQGTRIDSVIGGLGDDTMQANARGNYLIGGLGNDSLRGGDSHDHLYGGSMTALPGDGDDTLYGGGGRDYLQGNGGDDWLFGDFGNDFHYGYDNDPADRIYGGQGNDVIVGGGGNDTANGNLGDDTIFGGLGNDSLRGGQGDDLIWGNHGDDILSGDRGIDTLDGGIGHDLFQFNVGDAVYATSGADAYRFDTVVFDAGYDHIRLPFGPPATLHTLGTFATIQGAANAAAAILGSNASNAVAATDVGNDIILFYRTSAGSEAVKIPDIGFLYDLVIGDFV